MEFKINFMFTVMVIFTFLVSAYFIYSLAQAFKERFNEDNETENNINKKEK